MVARFQLACFFVFALALHKAQGVGRGSCREAQLCCTGRDGSCVVHPQSHNSIDSDDDQKNDHGRPCYCDHACLKVGDCCHDFQEVCGALDCQVSGWGSWSECSADCGIGTMTRERQVIKHPRNGGAHCPELLQKRSCFGSHCGAKTHIKANRETAMILPASYSTIRQLNATQDIRNNLRLRYRKDPEEENSKEYCVVFEVTKAKKTCESLGNAVSTMLEKGAKVCVACETAAKRKHLGYRCHGHGIDHKPTSFAYLAFPQCHGRWKRIQVSDKCTCNSEGKADFIFV
ncbi:RPE-spondin [Nephila pilipes]|uniref:RPE-spondin n=1 Tax=Nephila pilipes TaxID=299642 RepID=A0A8X6PIM6_NEPPI|nr:RPE-spondin [Nephila pilipes]